MSQNRLLKLLLCFFIPLVILLIPAHWIPLPDVSLVEQRIIAIFVMAALLWVLEPVPVFATSLLIITLELILVSNKGLGVLTHGFADSRALGKLLDYRDIFSAFSSPIIILFMGGFALAIAASKYDLDRNLARVLLRPFGNKVSSIMLGIMLITAVFSMFMSNTATTVMMLAIVGPLFTSAPKNDLGMKGLVLAVPIAANTGGIGTPIGTPPNAIALQYIPEGMVNFATWMSFGIPFVIVQLTIAWLLLRRLYPSESGTLTLNMEGEFQRNTKAYILYATFSITIILWLTTQLHGMNSYVVAIIPLAILTLTGVVEKEDLKLINWDVLWLVAGGIAMGMALENSGLAKKLAESINFSLMPTLMVIAALSFICYMMANFMSNTATANLLMPVAAAVATTLEGLNGDGGVTTLLVIVALSASLGMILPVSTPPNALAYSTGMIETKDLLKVGAIMGATGLLLLYIAMAIFL
jgi:sodium-dependent dicarboxylate transporter 2/3/5